MTTMNEGAAARQPARRRADPWFFLVIGAVLMALIFAGFFPTFYLRAFVPPPRLFEDAFFTPALYVHGFILTGWFALLIVQSALVQAGNVRLHRRRGMFGMVLAAALVISVVPVMLDFLPRVTRAGLPREVALGFGAPLFWFDVFNLIGFVFLVGWAWLRRNNGAFHKRLMMLASISLMVPAVFRAAQIFLPGAPAMPISLLVVVLLVAAVFVWDFMRLKRPHEGTLWSTGVIIVTYGIAFWVGSMPAALEMVDRMF
ncbi:hypothetical protein [Hyphomonas sp.]|uniref:hypothetical protein n=1 Tax=Hyphomonas sp. TaxID=87 RepID=UPI00391909FA